MIYGLVPQKYQATGNFGAPHGIGQHLTKQANNEAINPYMRWVTM